MKFFRGIRQSLIKTGNLKKYLLYAIGEILLVMIGISLAFQLSNWVDNRIKKNAEIRFYENIKDQIIEDKGLIQEMVVYNNRHMVQFKYANEIIENNDRSKLDTLGKIVRNLTNYSDFDKEGNIYETMVNSGQVSLLQNHEIVNGIRVLEETYNYINRMESIHYDAVIQHVAVAISPVVAFTNNEIKKPDEVFRYQFQNLVIMLMQIMDEKDRTYTEGLEEIEYILKLINDELDTK